MPKITKQVVDTIRTTGADYFIWDEGDGALKGFGVRVKPSGVASYLVQYRNATGATRRLTLGRVGTLTPAQARETAVQRLAEVAAGADPSETRHQARTEMTIGELCDWYLAEARAGRLLGRRGKPIKASTLDSDGSRIDSHVNPLIGRRPISWLTLPRLGQFQNDIAAGKTAAPRKPGRGGITTGGKGTASRTTRMVRAIVEHGRRADKVPANVSVRGIRCFADKKNQVFLTVDDLRILGDTMRQVLAEGWSRTGIAAVRGLLLTGTRKNELVASPRRWFDLTSRALRLGDAKNDAEAARLRPLGHAAVAHLAAQPEAGEYMFPADRGDGHFVGVYRLTLRLVRRAGIAKRVTPHIFRHTYGSIATELGYSELTVKGLIGHAKVGTTQLYMHLPDPALLSAADAVAARIADALDGRVVAATAPIAAPAELAVAA
jgi:integrase